MEQIARPLLILELTNSALMVGLLTATRMIPQLLLGIWAGVLADRMDKRRILLISQTVTLVTHLTTAALILGGLIEPWMVFVTTFITGSSMAFNQPARQSLIPRLVPDETLANAVALNSAAMNIMRIGGASFAGLILIFTDLGELYLIQGILYVWVLLWTYQISVRNERIDSRPNTSMLSDLLEGFSVVKRDRAIMYILVLCLILFVWGFPYQSVFVPLIAVESLDIGRSGAGLLVSMTGVGALIGSLTIATIGDNIRRRGLVMIGMVVVYAVGLLLLANAPTVALAIPALILTGGMQTSFMSLNNAFVLGKTPPELHGRLMSLFSLDRGLIPAGAAIGGLLAETLGPQGGLMVMACVCLTFTALITITQPALRRIR
jgi:MFS family permease